MNITGAITSITDANNNCYNGNCDNNNGLNGLKSDIKSVADQITSASIIQKIQDTEEQIQDNNLASINQFNVMQASLTAAQNQASLTSLNSFNMLSTSMLQGFNEVGRDAANVAAASTLANVVQTSAIMTAFCELKSTVKDESASVKALINDLRVKDLETQLQDAKNVATNAAQTTYILDKISGTCGCYGSFNGGGHHGGGHGGHGGHS